MSDSEFISFLPFPKITVETKLIRLVHWISTVEASSQNGCWYFVWYVAQVQDIATQGIFFSMASFISILLLLGLIFDAFTAEVWLFCPTPVTDARSFGQLGLDLHRPNLPPADIHLPQIAHRFKARVPFFSVSRGMLIFYINRKSFWRHKFFLCN